MKIENKQYIYLTRKELQDYLTRILRIDKSVETNEFLTSPMEVCPDNEHFIRIPIEKLPQID